MTDATPRTLLALVVINAQHNLFPEQEALLNSHYGKEGWDYLKVPAEGWDLRYMEDRVSYLSEWVCGVRTSQNAPLFEHFAPPSEQMIEFTLVFASPIPALMSLWAHQMMLINDPGDKFFLLDIAAFHNDQRVSKDVPDGKGGIKKISTVSPTGWKLV